MKNRAKLILAYIFFLAAVALAGGKPSSVNDEALAKHPPGRMAVSILWFENRAGTDAEHWRYGLKGSMSAAMRQVKVIRLRGGTGYARRELGIEKGAALTVEQARRIGEIVEAQRVVWGSYQGSSNSWQVTAFLLNVASGEVLEPITAVGTDWFDLRDAVAQQILEQLKINPSEEEKEKMLRRKTKSSQAYEWHTKAYAHQAAGSPLSVQEECERQAIKADPDFADAHTGLAAIHFSKGEFEEAEIGLRRALEIKPDLASAHHILGVIHLLNKQDEQALRELEEALRLDPENTGTLNSLSGFHATKEQWEQAMIYAEEAIALAPLDASLHAYLGLIYVNRHKRDRAMRELKEAERLADPSTSGDLNTLQRIGQSYRMLGEIPLAVEHYEKLVAQARTAGANPEFLGQFDKTLQYMKMTLTPTFVEAQMPRTYTKQALQNVLQEKLTPAELSMVVNPLASNAEINRWARQLTAGTTNEIDKARAIFDGLIQRIQLDGGYGKRTAREVFADWDDPDQLFSCQEFAKLYLALAREVGINAFYVHLGRDYKGKLVFHDCAIVFVDEKALLVDPACRWFGVPHQEFTVLNDVQTVAHQLFQHGPGDRSVARCRVAAKLHPDFAWGLLILAGALVDNDQLREATKVLEHAERLEPERWDAHRLRGIMAGKNEDWDTAMTHINKALDLNPEDARTRYLLGMTLLAQGNMEEARDAYRACLRNGPEGHVADQARRAIVQINENIGVESREEFETAALMVAIENGKIETVRQMLAEGVDANTQEFSGATALMVAAHHGQLDIVKLLLNNGADVNLKDNTALTALMVASHEGNLDIARLLLSAGADVNMARKTGETALHAAAGPGHAQVIKLLLKKGADVNATSSMGITPLMLAAEKGHTGTVRELIAAGADSESAEKNMGGTALFVASQNGHAEVVKLLLAADADINTTLNNTGRTPLHIAAENGHIDVIRQLLAAHAEVNASLSDSGATALHLAAKNNHPKIINLLLSANAKVDAACTDHATALLIASQNGHTDVVKLLLAKKPNVNAALKHNGYTPLIIAVAKNHANVVKLLLDAGADINMKAISPEGLVLTPLEIARKLDHEEIVELLQ